MSLDLAQSELSPIAGPGDLPHYFRRAERPASMHQVGLEHEKLIYPKGRADPVAYDTGIGPLLEKLERFGYVPFRESAGLPTIALKRDLETLSLEPGGQFELSGTPFETASLAHAENLKHLDELRRASDELGLYPVALGYRPFDTVEGVPWMPKARYRVMRETLPGKLALDMMLLTATGQVSLDWSDEADCARKVTVASRVAPLVVAMYANSPLRQGRFSGYLSYRSRVWSEVDPKRCGYFPAMVDGSFSYEAYVEWALDAPLLFLRRGGSYLRPKMTFRQLLDHGHEGGRATWADWLDHLSTLFPEVRLKQVLEVRGADSVAAPMTGALVALWRGLLYSPGALLAAHELLPALSFDEHLAFHETARKDGLSGTVRGRGLAEVAKELIRIARAGLRELSGDDAPLLAPLETQVSTGRPPALDVLDAWEGDKRPPALLAKFAL